MEAAYVHSRSSAKDKMSTYIAENAAVKMDDFMRHLKHLTCSLSDQHPVRGSDLHNFENLPLIIWIIASQNCTLVFEFAKKFYMRVSCTHIHRQSPQVPVRRHCCRICSILLHMLLYRNTPPNIRATIRWIGVGKCKNVTPIRHPIPIANSLAASTRGGCYPLGSCCWCGVIIAFINDLGTIKWAKMYPSVIHFIVSLTL